MPVGVPFSTDGFNPYYVTMRQAWAEDKSKVSQFFKNNNILEFGDYIWNHHKKCIQMSPNMPGICLDIC